MTDKEIQIRTRNDLQAHLLREHKKIARYLRKDIRSYIKGTLGNRAKRTLKYFDTICGSFGITQREISEKQHCHVSVASRMIRGHLNPLLVDFSKQIKASVSLQIFSYCCPPDDSDIDSIVECGCFLAFSQSSDIYTRGNCAECIVPFDEAVPERICHRDKLPGQTVSSGTQSATITPHLRERIPAENMEPLIAKITRLAVEKGRLLEVNAQLSSELSAYKKELGEALTRVHSLEMTGTHEDARAALDEVRRSGDTSKLLELLVEERDEYRTVADYVVEKLVKCDHEIAAVAYFTGNIELSLSATTEILNHKPDDFKAINHRGIINRLQGRLKDAEDDFAKVLNHALATQNTQLQASACENLGYVYRTQGKLELAEQNYQRALSVYQAIDDKEHIARTLNLLGHVHRERGSIPEALENYSASLALNQEIDCVAGIADSSSNIGTIHQIQGDWDKAIEMYSQALKIDEEIGFVFGVARCCGNLGIAHQKRGDLEKAERLTLKSLELNQKLGHKEGLAKDFSTLGILYKIRGDWGRSIKMHNKALAIDEALDRIDGMARDYGNLGVVYSLCRDYDKAEEVQRKALDLNILLDRKEGVASQYCNLGLIYHYRKDLDTAEEYYTKALNVEIDLDRKEGMALCYKNIGIVYRNRKDYDQALRLVFKAMRLNYRLKRMEGLGRDYEELGIIYNRRGNNTNARKCWMKSIRFFSKTSMLQKVADVRKLLERIL
jgi:tetratricopeptide (TPR) repeat protein